MQYPHDRSFQPRSVCAPIFRGTRDLKLSTADRAAIRAAERAFGYERRQPVPTAHTAHGLLRLILGILGIWLVFLILVAIAREASSGSSGRHSAPTVSEQSERAALKNSLPLHHTLPLRDSTPPSPSSIPIREPADIRPTPISREDTQSTTSFKKDVEEHIQPSLSVLPLTDRNEAGLPWPTIRVLQPISFHRLRRKRHSLVRRTLEGLGHVLEGAAHVAATPLEVRADAFPGDPQPCLYSAQ